MVITGGGPSGLALSVALSHQHIKNVVLELNDEICEDPRAIAVTGDTSRILRLLGVTDDDLSKIGQGSSPKLLVLRRGPGETDLYTTSFESPRISPWRYYRSSIPHHGQRKRLVGSSNAVGRDDLSTQTW